MLFNNSSIARRKCGGGTIIHESYSAEPHLPTALEEFL
jgi:hypothetical protein